LAIAIPLRTGDPTAEMSPLRGRMTEDMTPRNLSRQTQPSYLRGREVGRRFNGLPDRLGMEDIRVELSPKVHPPMSRVSGFN
jgi:hypothetical protein